MELQEQESLTTEETILESQEMEQVKTIKDELVAAVSMLIPDTELKLKLISSIESYLTQRPEYSIPDLTQMLWDNFNEYKMYLKTKQGVEPSAELDQQFRLALMPRIVELATNERLEKKTELNLDQLPQ